MSYVNVVGVQFRRAGKVYDFDAADYSLRIGDSVVVETERGPSLAEVARVKYVPAESVKDGSLKRIMRVASAKDIGNQTRMTPEEAVSISGSRVRSLGLDMRILQAEVQFSGNKIILYFNSPGRVDFRDLVKDLAGALRARVELKQVGSRDEAKLIGGLGICGREFCCSSFLREFVPVSIKMAKNQNLALNPTKISGGCGRLLCCLTYEDETYTALRKLLPPRGTRIKTSDERYGDVLKADFLNQLLLVEFEDGTQSNVKIKDAEIVERKAGVVEDEWADDIDLDALSGLQDQDMAGSSREKATKERDERGGQPRSSQERDTSTGPSERRSEQQRNQDRPHQERRPDRSNDSSGRPSQQRDGKRGGNSPSGSRPQNKPHHGNQRHDKRGNPPPKGPRGGHGSDDSGQGGN
jgi:cell fate regulator YaaT (PSP1 superfamily)